METQAFQTNPLHHQRVQATKRRKIIIGSFLCLLVLVNFPVLNKSILSAVEPAGKFKYANADGSYTKIQEFGFKDGYFQPSLIKRFNETRMPTPENTKLYRLYKINPFCFWRWNYYLSSSIKFDYRDWEDIEEVRGNGNLSRRWQDF